MRIVTHLSKKGFDVDEIPTKQTNDKYVIKTNTYSGPTRENGSVGGYQDYEY